MRATTILDASTVARYDQLATSPPVSCRVQDAIDDLMEIQVGEKLWFLKLLGGNLALDRSTESEIVTAQGVRLQELLEVNTRLTEQVEELTEEIHSLVVRST